MSRRRDLKRNTTILTFVMLTRLDPEAVRSPAALEDLEHQAMERVRKECPVLSGSSATRYWGLAIIWIYSALWMLRRQAGFRRWSVLLVTPVQRYEPRQSGANSKTLFGLYKATGLRYRGSPTSSPLRKIGAFREGSDCFVGRNCFLLSNVVVTF